MNDSAERRQRWVPTPRRSIHDHEGCIFAITNDIRRHGLNTQRAEENTEKDKRARHKNGKSALNLENGFVCDIHRPRSHSTAQNSEFSQRISLRRSSLIIKEFRRNINPRSTRLQTNKNEKYANVIVTLFVSIIVVAILTVTLTVDVRWKTKYDNSILDLQKDIKQILERNLTGCFILTYNRKSVKFDQTQFDSFLDDITITTAKYLRNATRCAEATIVQSTDLTMKTHIELMYEYRKELAKTGVMLVKDVDRLPSRLAMAFHFFCDRYNPLVRKTAIFLTLNLDTCASSEQKSTYINIKQCLACKWDTVPKHSINPLLERVINVIVDLNGII